MVHREEIEQFYKQNGIRHIRSAPYHPGLAERAVQSVKGFLKKETKGSLQTRVSQSAPSHRDGYISFGVANGTSD